jgi:hypothetical protein
MQWCTRRPVRISWLVAALVLLSCSPAHAQRTVYGLATRQVSQNARQEAIF